VAPAIWSTVSAGQAGDAERGAHRAVPRAVEQVVRLVVTGEAASTNGQAASTPNTTEGQQHAGEERARDLAPATTTSSDGTMRSAPSTHPRYQSGWAGTVAEAGSNGP
jgi:hypothetical protein